MPSHLPGTFLSYGQVGVGIRCGMEATIHTLRSYSPISVNHDRENLHVLCESSLQECFNECRRLPFLSRLKKHFLNYFHGYSGRTTQLESFVLEIFAF